MRLFVLLIITVFATLSAVGQTLQPAEKFVSIYGNFSLALPENPLLTRGLPPDETNGQRAGMIYAWDFENVVFTARYTTSKTVQTVSAQQFALKNALREKREAVRQNGGTDFSEKQITQNKLKPLELRAKVGSGFLIARFVQTAQTIYVLEAVLRDAKDEGDALKILDSFQIIDGRAVQIKKIDVSTPPALPRSPRLIFPRNDLQTANLKGRVKTVAEETEDLTGTRFQQGRIFAAEFFYDETGLQTKEIRYDLNGNPTQVLVFGFLENALVARFGVIRDETDDTPTENSPKTPFDLKIKYVFDEKGRVQKAEFLRSDGTLRLKRELKYAARQTETLNFDADNRLISKGLDTFAANGLLSESFVQILLPTKTESKENYRYLAFDPRGNWTKRIVSESKTVEGRTIREPVRIEYRKLTYF